MFITVANDELTDEDSAFPPYPSKKLCDVLPTNTKSVAPFFTTAGVTPNPPANISATVAYDCEIIDASVAEPL